MTKFVVDFDSEEFREAVKVSIKQRVNELTSNEIEATIEKIMNVKLGRVAKKVEELTDAKIDAMIHNEIKSHIDRYFTSKWGDSSDFGKVAERILREMMRNILEKVQE